MVLGVCDLEKGLGSKSLECQAEELCPWGDGATGGCELGWDSASARCRKTPLGPSWEQTRGERMGDGRPGKRLDDGLGGRR